jgi:hypothetical protein
MGTFISGTLVERQGASGIYYETSFCLPNKQIVPIFYHNPRGEDEDDPISEQLEPEAALNAFYELLVVVSVLRHVTYSPIIPSGTTFDLVTKEINVGGNTVKRNDLLRGKVIDPSWNTASLHYQAIATPKMYERHYALLETGIGNVVVSHKALQEELDIPIEQIVPGSYLEWKVGRLDLLAIIAKHTPETDESSRQKRQKE